ncbi:unnamed protein product [Durusdinium trenchii]|uniref:Uncharacterized protein n=1 Tax=Durusdinium trenchii TaxID=1381693 RepID=A0ABP0NSV9_9DINO
MSRAGCQLQLKDVNFISCCLCSRSSTKPGASSTEESHPRLLQESQGLEVLGLEEQLWPIDGAAHWCRRLRELREASPADEALRVLEEVKASTGCFLEFIGSGSTLRAVGTPEELAKVEPILEKWLR